MPTNNIEMMVLENYHFVIIIDIIIQIRIINKGKHEEQNIETDTKNLLVKTFIQKEKR